MAVNPEAALERKVKRVLQNRLKTNIPTCHYTCNSLRDRFQIHLFQHFYYQQKEFSQIRDEWVWFASAILASCDILINKQLAKDPNFIEKTFPLLRDADHMRAIRQHRPLIAVEEEQQAADVMDEDEIAELLENIPEPPKRTRRDFNPWTGKGNTHEKTTEGKNAALSA